MKRIQIVVDGVVRADLMKIPRCTSGNESTFHQERRDFAMAVQSNSLPAAIGNGAWVMCLTWADANSDREPADMPSADIIAQAVQCVFGLRSDLNAHKAMLAQHEAQLAAATAIMKDGFEAAKQWPAEANVEAGGERSR